MSKDVWIASTHKGIISPYGGDLSLWVFLFKNFEEKD
jgi:hypothetical protein|tara:strand:- start:26532 stop:26642 length:111 start_codon:yes stop_codon:yes gene_type:complete